MGVAFAGLGHDSFEAKRGNMFSVSRLYLVLLLVAGVVTGSAHAVYEKKDGFPWNLTYKGYHDKPIVDALGGGFFMNVGPTGIRAQITHEHPAYFTVRFVFDDSPAAGKIKPGDVIIGANRKVMQVPHKFGRRTVTGWEGPMESMAILIEEAQANGGKLELIVWPGGNKSEKKYIELQIEPAPRFSDTFPFNCERSDRMMKALCDFLVREHEREGGFGRLHTRSAAILALMASGDNRYSSLIREEMAGYHNKTYKSVNVGGFPCWSFGYDGIVMGEYYLLSKDKAILPAARSLSMAVAESQNPKNGGFTHRPYPVIANRVADGGPRGYGPMAAATGLVMMGQSLFKAGGLPYDEDCYERVHQGLMQSTNDKGAIGYGVKSWHHAVIELRGESKGKAHTGRGIGYPVPTGLEGIDEFEVVWPTAEDKRGGPTDWLRTKEVKKAAVYLIDKDKVLLVRDMSRPGPASPMPIGDQPVSHYVRTGTAALAHAIGNDDNPSYQHLANFYAKACANSPNALLDGHASTLMHSLWGSLGAARADARSFQKYMQGIKWWFIMAQTHDGGFVCMPGRDYASTDHVYGTRVLPSATAALILSVKEAKLQITGAQTAIADRQRPEQDEEQDRGDRSRQTTSVDLSMLEEGFTVTHCTAEAKQFVGSTPYARVLQSLDAKARGDGEAAREAAAFAEQVRRWLRVRTIQIIQNADDQPAQTLARSREHLQRMAGLSDANAILARAKLDYAGSDANTRTLSRYYEQLDKILAQEAERGPSASTNSDKSQLATLVKRYLQKPGLTPRQQAEATELLAQLE